MKELIKSMMISREKFLRLSLPDKRKILRELSAELTFQVKRVKSAHRSIEELKAEIENVNKELGRAAIRRDIAIDKLTEFSNLI